VTWQTPKTYLEVASDCALLVHTAFDYAADGVAKNKTAIDTLLDAGRRGTKPKTLVFTSGAWVYGDTGDRMVDETTPPNPPKLVACDRLTSKWCCRPPACGAWCPTRRRVRRPRRLTSQCVAGPSTGTAVGGRGWSKPVYRWFISMTWPTRTCGIAEAAWR